MPHTLRFPQDELAHNCSIEWWYWNGNLTGADGREYSYMECLFKADPKRVKLPLVSKLPVNTLFFRHGILCDLHRKKSFPIVTNFAITSTDSFTQPLLFINYAEPSLTAYFNCVMEQTASRDYHLKTEQVDLQLHATKKPLLIGDKGFVDLGPKKGTYYYSLPRLETEGTIRLEGKSIPVRGLSWMDHQWADTRYENDQWTWFSIQLDDGTDILCFEYGEEEQARQVATIGFPNGRQKTVYDLVFMPVGREWTSANTNATYPLAWRVESAELAMTLLIETPLREQELLFTTINYWEGPVRVEATFDGKRVRGRGFMELVGYPSNYGKVQYARKELRALTRKVRRAFG